MKTTIALFTLIISQSILAAPQKAQALWQCETQSDPDYASINLYSLGDEIYGVVSGEYGDGDYGISDLIELKEGHFGSREAFSFQGLRSIKGLRVAGLETRGIGATSKLNLEFTPGKDDSGRLTFMYKGQQMSDTVDCHQPVQKLSLDLNKVLKSQEIYGSDGHALRIYMRNWNINSEPKLSLTEHLASCTLTRLKDFGASQLYEIKLNETERDEGFNGCEIEIQDRDQKTILNFGYDITD